MDLICCLLAGEGRGNLQTYCPQFVILISFLIDLIDFIHGIQLSIYILLIPVISGHCINFDTVGWLQLFLLGMIFQLIYFCRKRPLVGISYWKTYSILYITDICIMYVYVMRLKITVKNTELKSGYRYQTYIYIYIYIL